MKFLYGNKNFIPQDISNLVVFNFSSLVEGYDHCNLLPPNKLGAIDEYDFDMKYAHFLVNNDNNFINLMNIICQMYYNRSVYLIISEDEWSMIIVESLLKFIQQRYGLNATYIKSFEDIYYSEDIQFNAYYGINNFDMDRERYLYLYEYRNVMNGRTPNGEY